MCTLALSSDRQQQDEAEGEELEEELFSLEKGWSGDDFEAVAAQLQASMGGARLTPFTMLAPPTASDEEASSDEEQVEAVEDVDLDADMLQQLLDDLRGVRDTPQLVYSTAGDWSVRSPDACPPQVLPLVVHLLCGHTCVLGTSIRPV